MAIYLPYTYKQKTTHMGKQKAKQKITPSDNLTSLTNPERFH